MKLGSCLIPGQTCTVVFNLVLAADWCAKSACIAGHLIHFLSLSFFLSPSLSLTESVSINGTADQILLSKCIFESGLTF